MGSSMIGHAFLERLDAALTGAVPSVSIAVHGEWSSCTRRLNQVEVVDHAWEARLTSATAFAGMAVLQTESCIYWAKAARASQEIDARVSFHAYAEAEDGQATFAVGLADVRLPGVPVVANLANPSECLVGAAVVHAGRVACLARCDGGAFFVLLFSRESVTFGRNRLWRIRDSIASQLPPDVTELLTRRRAGVLRFGAST